MGLNKKFIDLFHKVSVQAALASYYFVGKKDKIAADKAAVDAMRKELNKIDMKGQIVIGEGELDDAPMLHIGEKVGSMNGPDLDIAVDPLEGTNFAAYNLPGAISVIAVAEKNNLFNAPETYMDKISTNVTEDNIVDLDFSIKKNIYNLSEFKNKKPENLTACILDRPRHKDIIDELIKLKVKLKLITDGDVSGAILVTNEKFDVDIFLGIGGGPEGVLAASALDAYNCNFQGRFIFETEDDKIRAKKMGIKDFQKKYSIKEIVSGDSIFCATGITSGDLVSGIKIQNNEFISETLITHKSTGLKKIITNKQKI
ncbi:class II fructose-bisphosphatase [Pelagibacterales bacterium SAG-MED30]|nr:class II fructose-bisphosphatase [Pelagibacterales bacterium SAG-MED30]|tara:strand:+ start:579 stop:1520 length:942 start_codon:yes stop_codon:yes gene_type:complete